MGSFNLIDIVTGKTVNPGDNVACFLVHYEFGNTARQVGQAAIAATERFKLASLPLLGVYNKDGNVEIHKPSGIATQLALQMTGLTEAAELTEKAVGYGNSVQLLGKQNREASYGDNGDYSRTYGLAVVHESTFERLVESAGADDMATEANAVFSLLEQADKTLEHVQRSGVFESTESRNHLFSLSEACSLIERTTYLDEKLTEVQAPVMCSALSHERYHPDFFAVLKARGFTNLMYKDPRKEGDGDGPYRKWVALREYLSLLWATRRFIDELEAAGLELRPSRSVRGNTPIGRDKRTRAVSA